MFQILNQGRLCFAVCPLILISEGKGKQERDVEESWTKGSDSEHDIKSPIILDVYSIIQEKNIVGDTL